MEEDILLDMYRKAWDAFLEAYKTKVRQNEQFQDLLDKVANTSDDKGQQFINEQMALILEV